MEIICFLRNKEGHMIQCYSGSDGPKGLDDKDIELLRQERTEGEETADVQPKLASKSTLEVRFSISLRRADVQVLTFPVTGNVEEIILLSLKYLLLVRRPVHHAPCGAVTGPTEVTTPPTDRPRVNCVLFRAHCNGRSCWR